MVSNICTGLKQVVVSFFSNLEVTMNYRLQTDDTMLVAVTKLPSAASCSTLFTLEKLEQEEEG